MVRDRHARPRRSISGVVLLVVVALCAAAISVCAAAPTAASASPQTAGPAVRASAVSASFASTAQWTIAVYCDADNDLEKYWDQYSLPGLLGVPESAGVNVIAMVDRLSTSGTELVEIGDGAQTVVAAYPESNYGDGDTLQWFIETVSELYPSTHLAVIMWDHGSGWRYIARDQTSGGDRITMDELGRALADAGVQVDILAFDACNMADVAVAYEAALSGRVGIMVGSEESVPYNGFPYKEMLTPVTQDPSRTPYQVATDLVAGWKTYYETLKWAKSAHLSAVDLAGIREAAPDLRSWSAALRAGLPLYKKAFTGAASASWTPWATRYEDLGDLCMQLNARAAIADPAIKALSATVAADLQAALIAQDTAAKSAHATGLTIWWGVKNTWTAFQADFAAQVSFAQSAPPGVGWWAFLDAYSAR